MTSVWGKAWGKAWGAAWGSVEEPKPPSTLESPFFTPTGGGPGSQITLRQFRAKRRKRQEREAIAIGLL